MKKLQLLLPIMLITAIAYISSDAASAKINASWVRPDYKPKKFTKVLVLSDLKVITRRQSVENKISERLKKKGINAIPGITVITPQAKKPDKSEILKKIKDLQIDGVILISVLDVKDDSAPPVKEQKQVTVDHYDNLSWSYGDFYGYGYGYGYGYPGYYGPSYSVSYSISQYNIGYDPNWTDTSKMVIMDLKFYEIGKDILVWTAQSAVGKVDAGRIEPYIDAFTKTVADRLIEMKLIL